MFLGNVNIINSELCFFKISIFCKTIEIYGLNLHDALLLFSICHFDLNVVHIGENYKGFL